MSAMTPNSLTEKYSSMYTEKEFNNSNQTKKHQMVLGGIKNLEANIRQIYENIDESQSHKMGEILVQYINDIVDFQDNKIKQNFITHIKNLNNKEKQVNIARQMHYDTLRQIYKMSNEEIDTLVFE